MSCLQESQSSSPLKVRRTSVVNIDGEQSLLVVKAAEGSVDALVGDDQLSATLAIGQFEIKDLLSGSQCHKHKYLAHSYEHLPEGNEDSGHIACLWHLCIDAASVCILMQFFLQIITCSLIISNIFLI